MNKKGKFFYLVFGVMTLILILMIIFGLIYLSLLGNNNIQKTSEDVCKESCSSLNYTFYKYYCDGYICSNEHCSCFDKENKPIDIGRP